MKKQLFAIVVLSTALFSCEKTSLKDELPSLESFAKVTPIEWSEPITGLYVFDSCRNERVFVTGTQSYSLAVSFENGYYIDYIIYLDIDDAVGEFSGIHYSGKGKIE